MSAEYIAAKIIWLEQMIAKYKNDPAALFLWQTRLDEFIKNSVEKCPRSRPPD